MERLTRRNGNGALYFMVDGQKVRIDDIAVLRVAEHLAEYEDIGWTPEDIKMVMSTFHESSREELNELREILRAQHDGRLVVFPCKPGDKVWWLDYNRESCHDCRDYSTFYGMDSMCDQDYDLYPEVNSGDGEICPKHFIDIFEFTATPTWILIHRDDFGKTIFLTREEAEEALKKLRGGA